VGGEIRGPAIRLDFDDAALAVTGRVDTDEACPEEDAGDLGGAAAEEGPVQGAQAGLPG
jgi:hypothetical protein